MPDHPTPIHSRTHTSEPVPYLLYDSTKENNTLYYNEKDASLSSNVVENGYEMITKLFDI